MMRTVMQFMIMLGILSATSAAAAAGPIAMIDAHAHYSVSDAAAFSPEAVRTKLDTAKVRLLVTTSAPPQLAQQLYRQMPDRIIPMLGVYDDDLHKGSWVHDASLPMRVAAQLQSDVWAGIGELHLFARDAQQPVFAQLVRLAASHKRVLLIHGDAEVIEQAFAIAPEVRVLWAHLGTEPQPAALAQMLKRFPDTLWIDTSVRDERIAPNGTLLPAWRALFESAAGLRRCRNHYRPICYMTMPHVCSNLFYCHPPASKIPPPIIRSVFP